MWRGIRWLAGMFTIGDCGVSPSCDLRRRLRRRAQRVRVVEPHQGQGDAAPKTSDQRGPICGPDERGSFEKAICQKYRQSRMRKISTREAFARCCAIEEPHQHERHPDPDRSEANRDEHLCRHKLPHYARMRQTPMPRSGECRRAEERSDLLERKNVRPADHK